MEIARKLKIIDAFCGIARPLPGLFHTGRINDYIFLTIFVFVVHRVVILAIRSAPGAVVVNNQWPPLIEVIIVGAWNVDGVVAGPIA